MDVLWPPAYLSLASLALWSGLVPFWAALCLAPAGMVLGTYVVVHKGKQEGRGGAQRRAGRVVVHKDWQGGTGCQQKRQNAAALSVF